MKMPSILSKNARIVLVRRIKGFWEEFRTKKIGLFGMGLLLVYVFFALTAQWLTPYDPMSQPRIAQSFAMPEWVTIFPQYKDYVTTRHWAFNWEVESGSQFVIGWGSTVNIAFDRATPAEVKLVSKFNFQQIAPGEFYSKFRYEATNIQNAEYSLTLEFITPNGTRYRFWTTPTSSEDEAEDVNLDSKNPLFILGLGFELQRNVGGAIFDLKGEYAFSMSVQYRPLSSSAHSEIVLKEGELVTMGQVHGLLGTDYLAKDIFTGLIYGARMSLSIGLLAALAGTSIGIFVGVASGYLGGYVDEISMRIVDILICLPLLPLLLALVYLYGRNVFYIVLFIAIFGWQGLARIIRAQTLSIREAAYIDTAKASGASGFYIMLRHIVPNIIPVAFASMVLAVPGAILFEAAISFLGFGDPSVPTWGVMLQQAFSFGGFTHLAWWWVIPPGLAIIGLCLAFVFIGFAFDEIVNPRLRRRR
jgi:ABC-type dipeptide/oligopeptide/nickel transport system permease subunit